MTELTSPAPRHFGPSARALQQRSWIVLGLKGLILACLLLLAWRFQPPSLAFNALKWALVAGLAWGLWRAEGALVLKPLQDRSLSLHANALELRRGDFKRFVVFESLRHVRVVQSPGGERLLSLRLDTDDDSLLLRDFEGLPEVFAAVAGAKPERTLIEIDEQRVDLGEPLPWALGALALALLLAWVLSGMLEPDGLRAASGRLMLANGAALSAWRPLARGQHWGAVSGELGSGLVLALLGYYLA